MTLNGCRIIAVGRPDDLTLLTILFNIVTDLVTGSSQESLDAVDALEKPAISPIAQRYRTAAVVFFLCAAAFLFSAALAFAIGPQNVLNEILGWTGIVCLYICVLCGLRYSAINRPARDTGRPTPHED